MQDSQVDNFDEIKKILANDGLDEEELNDSYEHPFDVNSIDIVNVTKTIQQICARMDYGEIIIPDYQREYVWKAHQQSRLIESILLKIPLPTFYIDAKSDEEWIVIDGLQRITTIYNFYKGRFSLSNLEYLNDELQGITFKDFEEKAELKKYLRRFNETELLMYLIKPGTPKEVALNIFGRINTLGSPLSQQELRHALYQGKSTQLLDELSKLPSFIKALTQQSLRRMTRMSDKELILRLLAVQVQGLQKYDGSLSTYLSKTLGLINDMNDNEIYILKDFFDNAMRKSSLVFDNLAFRKIFTYDSIGNYRRPINKPLFETVAFCIEKYDDDILIEKKEEIITLFKEAMSMNVEYFNSLTYSTNTKDVMKTRFKVAESIFLSVCSS